MNEPRDPVDRLLKAELRSAGGDAPPPATSECVDAETFAAWADGTLPPQQTGAIELHLADCARCQAMMAAFVQTEPAVAAVAAPVRQPWFQRWAMPLAAAAAVTTLAVWLTRSTAPTTPVTPPASTMAENDARKLEPATRAPAQAQGQLGRLEGQSSTSSRDRTAMSQLAKNDKDQKSKEEAAKRAQANEAKTRADAKPAAPATLPAAGATDAAARQVPMPAPTPPPVATPPPPPPAGMAVGGVAQSAAQPTFRAAVAQNELRDAGAIAAEFSSTAFQEDRVGQAGAGGVSGGRGGGGGGGGRGGGARAGVAGAAEPAAFSAPRRWRVYASGIVERSTDGTNWERITIDPPAQLTNGVAPSPLVCWLVGRSGAVFISIDGSWFAKLVFPEVVDLTSVRATNAREATVTTADGRVFVTSDGGISWTIR